MKSFSRRNFLKTSAGIAGGMAAGAGIGSAPLSWALGRASAVGGRPDLVVVEGGSSAANCRAAIDALGGMSAFVRPGARVAIKPNPVGSGPPETAISTHPDIVRTVVALCQEAGASKITVFSHDQMDPMERNGIAPSARAEGASVVATNDADMYAEIPVPGGKTLRNVMLPKDLLEADVFINLPIAKHHAGSEVTLTMKNLMGVPWDRIYFHRTNLHQCIADITTVVKHDLIIMDANHVLLTNGPGGPGKVSTPGKVVAGIDPVAVDSYTTSTFLNRKGADVGHIRMAYDLGLGEMHTERLKIKELTV